MIITLSDRLLLAAGMVVLFVAGAKVVPALIRKRAGARMKKAGRNDVPLRESATIMYFWSAGCSQCRPQEAHLQTVRAELERIGSRVEVQKHDALAERSLSESMQVMTVPTTIVLDRRGNVAAWNPGLTGPQKLIEQVLHAEELSARAFDAHL
jgi:hypothetical protein